MLHMLATKNVSKMFEIYLDFRNVSSKYTEVKERGRGTKKKNTTRSLGMGYMGYETNL